MTSRIVALQLAVAALLLLPVPALGLPTFVPLEPFHLAPVAPESGILFEVRPTFFELAGDTNFGLGWLVEGRLAFLDRQMHAVLGLPFAMGFVDERAPGGDDAPIAFGDAEVGGGYGDALGGGGGRWGAGMRVALPTAGDSFPPFIAGIWSRPYDYQRHAIDVTTARAFADVGLDDGKFVLQLELGADFLIPDDTDNELAARFGFLVGFHLAPRTILMFEMTGNDLITDDDADGQFAIQPGIRFPASVLDMAVYLSVPVDNPLSGEAFAIGVQGVWNP